MKNRIVFFICTLDDGGAQRVVSTISSKLVERGFNVEILKYYHSNNVYPLNEKVSVNCVEDNTNSNNIFTNLKWMKNHFKDNADVIISFLAAFNILAILANLGNNIPIVVADRNDPSRVPENKIIRLARNMFYKFANCIVVQTNNNKNYFNSDKCAVIMNPFDNSDYIGKAIKTKKDNVIVSVGRLTKQKNHLMLINAFSKIKDKYPEYKLIIYGNDEGFKDVLVKKINELGLADSVGLPGAKNNILDLILNAKLFILPSDYEGMPNALIEAMCVGLPVISTKVSGATDLIKDNENGYLIDINNEAQLVEKIDYILSNDDKRKELAKNATKIANTLNIDNIVDKWVELINKV